MGNHYHFVAHTPRGNIARFMKVVNGRYAQYVNRRHHWTGHLFDGPYKALVIGDTCYLRTAMAYIARNPVEAGLVATPDKWKWSSYAAMVGLCHPEPFLSTTWLQRAFPSMSPDESRQRFTELVNDFPVRCQGAHRKNDVHERHPQGVPSDGTTRALESTILRHASRTDRRNSKGPRRVRLSAL
jgi:hypothetical protein